MNEFCMSRIFIPCLTFQKHVFTNKLAAEYLWTYYVSNSKDPGGTTIGEDVFIRSSEKILGVITDKDQIQFYLKV